VNAMNVPLTYKAIPRILCATHLTLRCEGAARRATLLAKQIDAQLLLVHVVDEAQPPELIGSLANRRSVRVRRATVVRVWHYRTQRRRSGRHTGSQPAAIERNRCATLP
jgi:hypothetical protein